MSRRADPERIHEARRYALPNRLTDEHGLSPELADQWIRAWETEAAVPVAGYRGTAAAGR